MFTGTDVVAFLDRGAAAVQVATRFTIARECGLSEKVKQEYVNCREVERHPDADSISVKDKTCLCTHMRNFDIWTCGHYAYRLKDTTRQLPDGSFELPPAEHIFRDYQHSTEHRIALPG